MSNDDDDDDEIKRLISSLLRWNEALTTNARYVLAEAERVGVALDGLQYRVTTRSDGNGGSPLARRRRVLTPEEMGLIHREVAAGVGRLDVEMQPDGKALVSVNERKPFALTPHLRMLLEILCTPGDAASDGLVAWQSRAQVAAALAARLGRPVGRSAVAHSVYRLRCVMEKARENHHLVLGNRDGLRFALRADATCHWGR